MNAKSLCSSFRESFRQQWECTTAPEGNIRVRTPYIYPDGDILDLFILARGDRYKLTDFGETVAWLRMRSGIAKLSPKRLGQVHDICQTHGVDFNRGQLELSGLAESDLPKAVVQLAGAAARTSDLWYAFPSKAVDAVSGMDSDRLHEEVGKWLNETGVLFKPRIKRLGRSGRDWSIDYETHTDSRTGFVFLMSTRSREMAQRLTEQVLAACVDLSLSVHNQQNLRSFHEQPEVVNISIFDDSPSVWRKEDFNLMKHASKVVQWPDQQGLERELHAA